MEKILITGALGQIGTELTQRLVNLFGKENVIALDIKDNPTTSAGFYEKVDIANTELISQIIDKYQITIVYHLASLLSGTSEKNPQLGLEKKNLTEQKLVVVGKIRKNHKIILAN